MCKHLNGILYEIYAHHHSREVENGKVEETGINEQGDITGYMFQCSDCKREFNYTGQRQYSKWIRRLIDQL